MPQPNQPLLHQLTTLCAAPSQVLSAADGSIAMEVDGGAAQGLMHADVRVLSGWQLRIGGRRAAHLATELATGGRAQFSYLAPVVAPAAVDRFLRIDLTRDLAPGLLTEILLLTSELDEPAEVDVTIELVSDLTPMNLIKIGRRREAIAFGSPSNETITFGDEAVTARLQAPGAAIARSEDRTRLTLTWRMTVPAGGLVELDWLVSIDDSGAVVGPARDAGLPVDVVTRQLGLGAVSPASISRPDARLEPWLRQSLHDLAGLRMTTTQAPDDAFYAAGSPWYFTLFGRDSLWTSRFLLDVDVAQAGGTLRTLARLAGTISDPETAQDPGKIMHELRRGTYAFNETSLPPLYYGTIDATPLWICLLHDAWRAGLPEAEVTELLPALEGALRWLVDYGDADGDGFIEYIDASGHGLTNQGWKDSRDSVRFADGRIAQGPVALCEVQGYAYEAAVGGARLLEAFHRPGANEYRDWAGRLADRFRTTFWCGVGDERYPALALDGAKRQVDSVTSNIGHLLGTGLLDAHEEELIARRVTAPDLDSGLGLRTMSTSAGGYSPLSYHCGTVWPHDTAIVINGLLRIGRADLADGLAEGLLRAALAFDWRLPELWSGEGRPVPYPAACRPQAWSAASAVVVARWAHLRNRVET
ncbi:MAG: glycogen debranching N-terminal domain-containing protein [Microlunatus sp.]